MAARSVEFVTTTINEPVFLEGYLENVVAHGHDPTDIGVTVVGDLKTPLSVREFCEGLTDEFGIDVDYLSVDDQRRLIEQWELLELDRYLPYNSIQRRNVGYLAAAAEGADVIVSLDDDNLAREDDIAGLFSTVGDSHEVLEVTTENNWYNPASMLTYEAESSRDIYHRGFPYSRRDTSQTYDYERTEREVMVRAGLWFDVPDIDVITHLERGPRATSLREEFEDELVALGDETFAPVNTQNTAFHTDLMPLIHTIPMGQSVRGMEVSRFDDIWLGYFLDRVLHETGGTVAYGGPISTHDRNTHNLKRELEHEAVGVRLNEIVVDTLESIEIEGDDHGDYYRDLIRQFRAEIDGEVDYEFEAYFNEMLDGMETWADACDTVLN